MSVEESIPAIAECLLGELKRGTVTEPMVNDIMDHCVKHQITTDKEYLKAFSEIRREHLYTMMGYEI